MPVGLGIMQSSKINFLNTVTTVNSISPTAGTAFCNDTISFTVQVDGVANLPNTTIDTGSNGVSLPTSVIHLVSTAGYSSISGAIYIPALATTVNYTNVVGNTITGCTGGAGTMLTGQTVKVLIQPPGPTALADSTISVGGVSLPQSVIHVVSTSGFATTGTLFIPAIDGLVNYTGTTPTSFTGCTGGSGALVVGQLIILLNNPLIVVQDVNSGFIPTGGTGTLSPFAAPTSSNVTLTMSMPPGNYNFQASYPGALVAAVETDLFNPSQSAVFNYLVKTVTTATFLNGPASFVHTNPATYSIIITSVHGAAPSSGLVTLTATQAGNHSGLPFVVGTGTPTAGALNIIVPGSTFIASQVVHLSASYAGDGTCYTGGVSNTFNSNPT